ncbi:uncharacterized protein DUF3971 [Hoeflea marina]|uniref:Uncharacterized protein DUF3971 n=1 Tax=Hoeflea marina TaxID=274592 RepID=A0A317PTU1_9HYPH|nr:DUF3971 domain-containing protein [Hoeflea marina]PWW04357.1 uncharacterized protein DUF3971 [Hoeflea marina]
MPETPIEEVWFDKRDIVSLHELPSAQAHDPIIVQAHHGGQGGGHLRRLTGFILGLAALLAIVLGGLFIVIERGWADQFIYDRARLALAKAVGPDYVTELSSAVVRVTPRGRLALEARGVTITPADPAGQPTRAARVRLVLEPMALATGDIEVASIEISGIAVTAPQGRSFQLSNFSGLRIDALEGLVESAFVTLNMLARTIDARQTRLMKVTDLTVAGVGEPLQVREATLTRAAHGGLRIAAQVSQGSRMFALDAQAEGDPGESSLSRIAGTVDGLDVDFDFGELEDRKFGALTTVGLTFRAERAGPEADPVLEISAQASPGTLTMGGIASELVNAELNLSYVASARKIEIMPSRITVGDTVLPFTGGLIDNDRLPGAKGEGIAFDLVVKNGVAAPGDSEDLPIRFDAKAFGRFLPLENRIIADELAVVAGAGSVIGSASFGFVQGKSPEINLYAETARLPTAAARQLWPYWLGRKGRQWVLNNLYGGTIRNGRIQLAIPSGHFRLGEKVPFTDDEFQIDFDIERARINVAGDIPPLRDTLGHLTLRGTSVKVDVNSATAYFPTGRTVAVRDGVFAIPNTDEQPLMADLNLAVSGDADAVAELITYHPIKALDRIGLVPNDLSGAITSRVQARFGLIQTQSPPAPDWKVDLQLDDVDISQPVEGRILTELNGSLVVTPDRAELKADALVDSVPFTLDVVQPVGTSKVAARRVISGTLDDKAREKLAPGTAALISGPVGFTMDGGGSAASKVELDLKRAVITIPGFGWTKSAGIAAKASFDLAATPKTTSLSDFKFSGDGFAMVGALTISDGRLSQAKFSQVALSPRDDYRLSVDRTKQGYRMAVSGNAIDLRPLIATVKQSVAKADGGNDTSPVIDVEGKVDTVYGFFDEKLSAAAVRYSGQGDRADLIDFKAVTSSGQAAILAASGSKGGGESIEITSGDAGAFARFAGVYDKVQGGLLNIRLSRDGGKARRGVIDIRNFSVVGEKRLDSLVSTKTGADGRSLNDVASGRINSSTAKFDVANARVDAGQGQLVVREGILRGPEIGASYQGTLYDRQGNMDMTGTFMPAYALNSLFAELPIIGAILGNGRDRGLFGITFRLAGKAASPNLTINPLSAIAPGVFRSIFEFRN